MNLKNLLPILLFLGGTAAAGVNDPAYFSTDYSSARAEFARNAALVIARFPETQVRSFAVPSRQADDLTVDYLFHPARERKERLFILVSGVHGMEGFAGSAIQLMFLKEFAARFGDTNTGFLLVHALNPFGFKYHRRATEANVNLNRNFSLDDDAFRTVNTGYRQLAPVLAPAGPVQGLWASVFSTLRRIGSEIIFGTMTLDQVTESIGQGQYEFPRGIEYGGQTREPQVNDFVQVLKQVTPGYREIVLLDLHTGLGKQYTLHLMPGDAAGSVNQDMFGRLFHPKADRDVYEYTSGDTDGFYHTHGDLCDLLPQILETTQKTVSVTVEFGTVGNGPIGKLQTLNRLILENQGFHNGYADSPLEAKVRNQFAELFSPSDRRWRQNVIERARELFKRMFARLDESKSGLN